MMAKAPQNIANDSKEKDQLSSQGFISILISTFLSVFLAELGDKTQIATLLLSAQSGKPLIVFAGSALALIFSSLGVVILGKWIGSIFPQVRFTFLSGVLMIGLGIWLGIQSYQGFYSNDLL